MTTIPTAPNPDSPEGAKKARADKLIADASNLGCGPAQPAFVTFKDANKQEHKLPAGFYLLYGGTGSGKTITTVALIYTLIKAGYDAQHLYCYEARGATMPPAGAFYDALADCTSLERSTELVISVLNTATDELKAKIAYADLLSRGGLPKGDPRAVRMQDFFETIVDKQRSLLGLGTAVTDDVKPSIIALDSVSLPLRAFGGSYEQVKKEGGVWVNMLSRKGEPTMSGGFQPSDIAFVVEIEALALATNTIIIGVINDDLVPFASQLEGMSEGYISIEQPGVLTYRQRLTRAPTRAVLSKHSLDVAQTYLGYETHRYDVLSNLGVDFGSDT